MERSGFVVEDRSFSSSNYKFFLGGVDINLYI